MENKLEKNELNTASENAEHTNELEQSALPRGEAGETLIIECPGGYKVSFSSQILSPQELIDKVLGIYVYLKNGSNPKGSVNYLR